MCFPATALRYTILLLTLCTFSLEAPGADENQIKQLSRALRELNSDVFAKDKRAQLSATVHEDLRRRLLEVSTRSSKQWYEIKDRGSWERFRKPHLAALRRSLGEFPEPPKKLRVHVTGKISGDGFRIENVVYQSRPGLWVTANLYLPAKPTDSMPGIILCHSHHRPKEHGELQDMGMTWARSGCVVLVPDHLGHGERRQHPFAASDAYAEEFRVSRQDYYFRYDTGIQLHLAGDSLIGWVVWDLMRGVDLLLSREGVDPQRIILLGAVAGGGEPAAVTAALDERIACAVPFNFGGPHLKPRFPLPKDIEQTFNYAGSGSWESTRNLRLSASDGFLPWVIVGGIAPRRMVFAHEFNWHRERDPVWKRLQTIYGSYDQRENLAYTHGRGEVTGRPPEATHCTHIGRTHRVMIHAAFKQWFGISVDPDKDEYSNRLPADRLRCMTLEVASDLKPRSMYEIAAKLSDERTSQFRAKLAQIPSENRLKHLREAWANVLGGKHSIKDLGVNGTGDWEKLPGGAIARGYQFEGYPLEVPIPVLWLVPPNAEGTRVPAVVAVAQQGKAGFLQYRSDEIAQLLSAGVAVCLPDLRNVGELRSGGNERGRYSADTSRSSTELMLGDSALSAQLHDLRVVMYCLRNPILKFLNTKQIALWGDSFAEVNPKGTDFKVPRRVDGRPKQSEPLGGLLALLGALDNDRVKAVYVHRGLTGFRSVLDHWQVFIPHDVVVPGVLKVGDLSDVAAALAPRPLRLEGLVDGLNRSVSAGQSRRIYQYAVEAYRQAKAEDAIIFSDRMSSPAEWLIAALKEKK